MPGIRSANAFWVACAALRDDLRYWNASIVVLADDAFTFLVSWEFMSL